MKRSHLLFLTAAASIGLLLIVISTVPKPSNLALAAPQPDRDLFKRLTKSDYAPLYQGEQVSCTLTVTTTDSLNNRNACPPDLGPINCGDDAVALADYTGLALVPETDVPAGEIERPVHADWFRLDNAEIGALYTVEALPSRTTNYNLGIVVYGPDDTPILRDDNAIDNNSALVTLEADSQGPYFFQVYQLTASCTGRNYSLETSVTQPTPTPTATAPPTTNEDAYEPNDRFEDAPTLPIQVPILLELTFHTVDDRDYFQFYTKSGRWYQGTTSDLNRVDTLLEVYDQSLTRIERDDDGGGGLASKATWQAAYDGYYFIVVQNNVESAGSYNLTLEEIAEPTPGPSPTPGITPTPRTDADDCERNFDFENACVIPVNESRTFNFIPARGEGPDNDFYKIWVKPGLHFRCETLDLDPGVDPNMIMFSGPSWDHAVAGNDDIEPCNFNSALNFYATYSGWLYILLGTGERTPPDIRNSSYTLRCEKSTQPFAATPTPQPTATSDASGKLPTPVPTATTPSSPVQTPTPQTNQVTVRALTTPTPPPTPAPRFVPVSILAYYDANGDGQRGAGEGIAELSVYAYEVATSELLAEDFTDEQGNAEFTVSTEGIVRISIPFLGFNQLVTGDEATIHIRVPPHRSAGGAP